MTQTFELREVVTGRLMGVVQTAVDMSPGELVIAFRQDKIQVDAARVQAAQLRPSDIEPPAKPTRKGRR